jgi:hypothetical protein
MSTSTGIHEIAQRPATDLSALSHVAYAEQLLAIPGARS